VKSMRDMTEPELRKYFRMLGEATESVMPPGPGRNGRALFVLIVFDDPKLGQYVSNCDRTNMVQALRETADRLESRSDIPR
jgi:hypothetical protein